MESLQDYAKKNK